MADSDHVSVIEQVRSVPALVGLLDVEQPADMGVPQTLGYRAGAGAVPPRRVRVTVLVAEGVVASVVGNPADHRALDRHVAGDGERDAYGPGGLEPAVGEVPVETDGHAVTGDHIHDRGQDHISPADPLIPQQGDRRGQRGERNGDDRRQDDLLASSLDR